MSAYDYDLFVIGAGSGGVRAARMASQLGKRVAVAEAGALGGTCVNLGCIPKKLYSYAADYAEGFEEAHGYGWTVPDVRFDWEVLKRNRAHEIGRLNEVYRTLLTSAGVRIIHERARLADIHVVEAGGVRYTAETILVATGSAAHVPDIPGAQYFITSNDIFDLDRYPSRLLVMGGGYIACEFSSIFNGLGSSVTQVYRGEQVLRGFDEHVREFIATEMRNAGIDIRVHTNIVGIEKSPTGFVATLTGIGEVEFDAILCAAGRRPNVDGLGLRDIGVLCRPDGAIEVDRSYRTSVPSVRALGDVIGGMQLTPVALAEAMVLIDHVFGSGQRQMDYRLVPTAVFTHPNIGTVGLTESEARASFPAISVFRTDFKPLRHALSGSQFRVFMKLIVESASDRVVGLHMVGPDAGEIVQGFAVAMTAGATKAMFDRTIGIHPTIAEEFVTMRSPVNT